MTDPCATAHLPDLIQLHVLRRAGLDVRHAELMHLDRGCRYPQLDNLFVREDVTHRVEELLPAIPTQVRAMQRVGGPAPRGHGGGAPLRGRPGTPDAS